MLHRRRALPRPAVVTALVLAALPDVLHLLPIAGWWVFADGSFAALRGYAVAVPGQEPGLPPMVQLWSHIVIDVFTHSADYYEVPVRYPFTERGFDGIAWVTPWFMVLNYVALPAVGIWLVLSHRNRPGR